MLRDIKKKSTSFGSLVIMGLLIIAFAFWGVSGSLMSSNNDSVAVVNGTKITLNDYNKANQAARDRMTSQFGEAIGTEFFESENFKRGVVSQLVDAELMRQQATKFDYDVSPLRIKETIESAPSLQIDGKFSKEAYANYLMTIGKSAELLQRELRDDLTGSAIPQLIAQSAFSLDSEVNKQFQYSKQTRSIEHFEISANDYKDKVEVSDDDIQQHYNEFGQDYMTQEQVSVNYIELSSADLTADLEVTEEEILKQYDARKDNSLTPERRKTSHILLSVSDNADDVKEKMIEVAARISNGEPFESVAKEVSEDPGSAENGGDLGWVEKGDMVEGFETALFAMQAGTVSEPVLSDFGYHLIKLDEIKEPEIAPLEDIRDTLVQEIKNEKAEEIFLSNANQLEEAIVDSDNVLEMASDTSSIEIKTTELFTRSGGAGISANQEFVEIAFSDFVLNENEISEMITLGDNHIAYIQLNEHKPATVKELEEVKDSIKSILTSEKSKEMAKSKADELLAKMISSDISLRTVASEIDKTVIETTDVARTGSSLPFNLVNNIFKLNFDSDKPETHVVESSGNSYALIQIKDVKNPEVTTITEEDKVSISTQIERTLTNNELINFTNELKTEASITINEAALVDNNQ